MKLLTKTTLFTATLSLFLFFFMGIIFFQVLKNMSIADLNRELRDLKGPVELNLSQLIRDNLREFPGLDSLSYRSATGHSGEQEIFGDTLVYDSRSQMFRTYRFYQFESLVNGQPYHIRIYKSTTPTDQLVERVTLLMTLMVILFLAGIFVLNRYIFANLWKDFFLALEKLKQFDSEKEPVSLMDPDIEEFAELNKVLERMTTRLANEYRELKEYTDHTTHELQTPLAVIKTKTELLLQSDRLGPGELELIRSIYTGADQLAKLNHTLALITRIENRQFTKKQRINVCGLIDRHLEMLQELVEIHELQVNRIYRAAGAEMIMDQGLADVLITNLLKNAIVHNTRGGRIDLEVETDRLVISNTGTPLPIDPSDLFNRFTRDPGKKGSFGLGLSLVRKICDFYGFTIRYVYRENLHSFVLVWEN